MNNYLHLLYHNKSVESKKENMIYFLNKNKLRKKNYKIVGTT